jgi:[NiFe] hydrogenase diaphorase moiety small subunit
MSEDITLTIDDQKIQAKQGQTIVQAAQENGIFIPTLCALRAEQKNGLHNDLAPGACRICTVMINGRPMAACTTPVIQDMVVENDTEELNELRKTILELLFVEGNHFCPSCEKSGFCDLQALAYRYQMLAPRFHYAFPDREVHAEFPKLLLDRNRCILCRRCAEAIRTPEGKPFFGFTKRGDKSTIAMDKELVKNISDEQAQQAMHICPVGSIIYKGKGFDTPLGQRKYDHTPIGSETTGSGTSCSSHEKMAEGEQS